jgi:2-aminoadipate transaminase
LYELLASDFIPKHTPSIRALYKEKLETMQAALQREMPASVVWNKPIGGMFLWVTLPKHIKSEALLLKAVDQGIAFVPGAAFYANENEAEHNKLRLSFVTASLEQINTGIAILAQVIKSAI